MERVSEFLAGWTARNSVLFTSSKRRLTSVEVRGVQMAEEMGGHALRNRYLREPSVQSSKALIWIVETNLELVEKFRNLVPQIFEPINPRVDPAGRFNQIHRAFENVLLNTRSEIHWLGSPPDEGWKQWVIPHHHCNRSGYSLPEARLEKPLVVGYLGESIHLHDTEEIQQAVEKMGMRFLNAPTNKLDKYREIDIGIAWTRREEMRDQCRSNIKLANFCGHGIPSVVCDYESYRDVDAELGGEACLIRRELSGFIEGISQLVSDETLRRKVHLAAKPAYEKYSRKEIAKSYWKMIEELNADFTRRTS